MGVRVGERRRGRRHLELCRGPKVCCLFELTCLCLALFLFLSSSLPLYSPTLLLPCSTLPCHFLSPCLILFVHYHFTWLCEKTPRCHVYHISPTIKKRKKWKPWREFFYLSPSLRLSLYLCFLLELCAVSWHDLELF